MKIAQLTISNFRCFGPEPTTFSLGNLTTLIGTNGTGKTAILHALSRLFGRSSERDLTRDDFHIPSGVENPPDEITLYIEVRIEFPNLGSGVERGIPECFRQMIVNAPGANPFCRVRLDATWQSTAQMEGEIDSKLNWIISAEDNYAEDAKQRMSNYDRGRIHVLYVPATRDPLAQLRKASGALLQPLMNAIRWKMETREATTEAADQVRDAIRGEAGLRSIEDAISREWKKLQSFPSLREMQLQPLDTKFDSLLRQMEAVFFPSGSTQFQPIDRLSDGLRSLFYFSMLGARYDLEQSPEYRAGGEDAAFEFDESKLPVLTVFAIEEPENHLSPHYLGRILNLLKRLAEHAGAQVILTSQSAAILGRIDPECVRHLRLNESGHTQIRPITLPSVDIGEAYKYVKESVRAHPELYFSTAVVLGEGDSEMIVLPRVASAHKLLLDQRFISVVPLGGRHVNHFWRLLSDLGIPFVTLLDLDRERFGGCWGRIHYAVKQLEQHTGISSGITKAQLDAMPTYDIENTELIDKWTQWLEDKGVFFSSPLDLDFLMLRAFPSAYEAATDGTGPQIPEEAQEFEERVNRAIDAVLKPEGGDGHTYTKEEQKAFIWYQYLFLGRGKPTTHIRAINGLTNVQIKEATPAVLLRLLNKIIPPTPPLPPQTRHASRTR